MYFYKTQIVSPSLAENVRVIVLELNHNIFRHKWKTITGLLKVCLGREQLTEACRDLQTKL